MKTLVLILASLSSVVSLAAWGTPPPPLPKPHPSAPVLIAESPLPGYPKTVQVSVPVTPETVERVIRRGPPCPPCRPEHGHSCYVCDPVIVRTASLKWQAPGAPLSQSGTFGTQSFGNVERELLQAGAQHQGSLSGSLTIAVSELTELVTDEGGNHHCQRSVMQSLTLVLTDVPGIQFESPRRLVLSSDEPALCERPEREFPLLGN